MTYELEWTAKAVLTIAALYCLALADYQSAMLFAGAALQLYITLWGNDEAGNVDGLGTGVASTGCTGGDDHREGQHHEQ